MTPEQAAALREPFPESAIGYLPKGGVLLAYVGHAAASDRLLKVDPEWSWEPFALDENGLPALDSEGNLWIRLTVCGITRPGVGDGKNAKERIGDAIRNAAMRFGVALDLWAKEDLHAQNGNDPRATSKDPGAPASHPPLDEVAPQTESPETHPASPTPSGGAGDLKPTPGQRKKLGILVATLRDRAAVITTENLWAALANSRSFDVEQMIALLHGRDEDGVLHFGPLLADLTRGEASNLIDRLERLEKNAGVAK